MFLCDNYFLNLEINQKESSHIKVSAYINISIFKILFFKPQAINTEFIIHYKGNETQERKMVCLQSQSSQITGNEMKAANFFPSLIMEPLITHFFK